MFDSPTGVAGIYLNFLQHLCNHVTLTGYYQVIAIIIMIGLLLGHLIQLIH